MFFWMIWAAVASQRLLELALARRNGRIAVSRGGYEAGASHYPLFIALHLLFMTSLAVEAGLLHAEQPGWWLLPFAAFAAAQWMRLWAIKSLGVHWNTRIYVTPGMTRVQRGPYRFMRHPNYAVVMTELIALPLAFGAYWTAVLFPLLNAPLLLVRIRAEEAALSAVNSAPKLLRAAEQPVWPGSLPVTSAPAEGPDIPLLLGASADASAVKGEPKLGSGANRA